MPEDHTIEGGGGSGIISGGSGGGGIPSALRDFLFDLYDSVRTSQIPTEQHTLYTLAFRELTAKYFAQNPWPSPQSIADECDGDPLFLALYHELTHRHLHTVIRPTVHDRIDGWHVYRTLFDILIEEFDTISSQNAVVNEEEEGYLGVVMEKESSPLNNNPSLTTPPPLYILPEWAFDILHEFVYQFQGFCQFRVNTMAQANKFAIAMNQNIATTASVGTDTIHAIMNPSLVDENTTVEATVTTTPSSSTTTEEEETPAVSNAENETTTATVVAATTTTPPPVAATATKKHPPAHLVENIRVLNENKDAWAIETVMYYLHRLISMGSENGIITSTTSTTSSSSPKKKKVKVMNSAMQYLGVFSSITLSRLECLLGDHSACLAAVTPLMVSSTHSQYYGCIYPPPMGITANTTNTTTAAADEVIIPTLMVTLKPSTPEDLISSVLAARISMSYHAGVSFLMLRRYKDAIRTLSSTCAFMQRGLFKSVGYTPPTTSAQQQQPLATTAGGTPAPAPSTLPPSATVAYRKNLPVGFDQLVKMYDRMVALLAILSHVCSIRRPNPMDESVQRYVLERHGHQLAKIESGEEGYEELFLSACPKFIIGGVPNYETAFTGGSVVHAAQDAIKLQVKHFMKEVASAASIRKLRSYMKLYTSISVEKLGRLVLEDNFLSSLLACKYNMYQLEMIDSDKGDENEGKGMAMDTHFFIHDSIIHIDEEEKQNRFESFFISQITQNKEILKDVQKIIGI